MLGSGPGAIHPARDINPVPMKSNQIIPISVLLVLLAGCVSSMYPFYTPDDLVRDDALLGKWRYEQETWKFEQIDSLSYRLIHVEDGKRGEFVAHLVLLDSLMFLDLYPVENKAFNGMHSMHLIPTHTFSRIWLGKDRLTLAMFDYEKVKALLARDSLTTDYVVSSNRQVVLTGHTATLQQFALSNLDLFGEGIQLHR